MTNNDEILEMFTRESSQLVCVFLRLTVRARLSDARGKVCRPASGAGGRLIPQPAKKTAQAVFDFGEVNSRHDGRDAGQK